MLLISFVPFVLFVAARASIAGFPNVFACLVDVSLLETNAHSRHPVNKHFSKINREGEHLLALFVDENFICLNCPTVKKRQLDGHSSEPLRSELS